jgi:hypothetical protein
LRMFSSAWPTYLLSTSGPFTTCSSMYRRLGELTTTQVADVLLRLAHVLAQHFRPIPHPQEKTGVGQLDR